MYYLEANFYTYFRHSPITGRPTYCLNQAVLMAKSWLFDDGLVEVTIYHRTTGKPVKTYRPEG